MTTVLTQPIEEAVSTLVEAFAQTASERDKKGGTAKAERDLLRKSGLLRLHTDNWTDILAITRQIAKVDSSLAHLFGYHFLCCASVELYGTAEQVEKFRQQTIANDYF